MEYFFPSHQFQSICIPRSDVGLIDSIYVSCFHSTLNPERIIRFEFVAIFFRIDFICSGLMVWASGSMVVFLHNHTQRIQHIHSNSHSSRTSAEARATSNIFVLVNSFHHLLTVFSFVHLDESVCYSRPVAGLYTFVFMFPNSQPLCAYLQCYSYLS